MKEVRLIKKIIKFTTLFIIILGMMTACSSLKMINENKNHIIIFYRPDCPDCQKIYDQMAELDRTNPQIIMIDTTHKTESIKKLIEDNNIKYVPSATFVDVKNKKRQTIDIEKIEDLYELTKNLYK